ncbi:MAG: serine dehydratase subunit alpha family protein [Oscillospiraceae bacterium]|nr:serine dehydratase subunit alpha family protein [Oscillospiraceae bacterium]
MQRGDHLYQQYLNILREELRPAMGCTEPIALAYAGAKARQVLGAVPDRIRLFVSGNIIKNVKSVVVPNTGGLHGMAAALCAGIVAGNPDRELQVICDVPKEAHAKIRQYMETVDLDIQPAYSDLIFDIDVFQYADGDCVRLRIINHHTNIVTIEKNGQKLLDLPITESSEDHLTDKSCLSMENIVAFADCLDIEDVRDCVGEQIRCNLEIAEEGLNGDWGANIGSVILRRQGQTVEKKASAWAAAGSDARMSGCEKPVMIVSGSGNQGMTASIPVAIYARETGATEEQLLKAVALSDLVTIHQKAGIGRLSAYCGAISAGCGAGAGIAYLQGGDARAVAHTVVNAIAILSGTICDGAKPSCAAKIAAAVDAGILGYHMYLEDQQFYGGDGIVTKGADNTVHNIGRLAREGMRETDRTILEIMMQSD